MCACGSTGAAPEEIAGFRLIGHAGDAWISKMLPFAASLGLTKDELLSQVTNIIEKGDILYDEAYQTIIYYGEIGFPQIMQKPVAVCAAISSDTISGMGPFITSFQSVVAQGWGNWIRLFP